MAARVIWKLHREKKCSLWERLLRFITAGLFACVSLSVSAQQRFPPPDFESGYVLPSTPVPSARSLYLEYLDLALLTVALGLASYFVFKKRSRRAVLLLSLGSLAYFGFYRKGCICAIGSIQNVALALSDAGYTLPLSVLGFFVLPLVVSLFAGRTFCAAVCPHGALQDLFLLKPVPIPLWLEHGLGVIPYLYLGAGVAFAATGTGFLICRYDPLVPLFRLSGSLPLLLAGAGLLAVGLFVGRPYCRFLCPYGALLKLGALVSKLRVRITPNVCTQCRLCEQSCPFGAIRSPLHEGSPPVVQLAADRRQLAVALLLLPVFVAFGAALGSFASSASAQLNPTVKLAKRLVNEEKRAVSFGTQNPAILSLVRAQGDPEKINSSAARLRQRFHWASMAFGGWAGLVVGGKLLSLVLRRRQIDFEPDRGACFACARCFLSCPNERLRCGMAPGQAPEVETAEAASSMAAPIADKMGQRA